MPLTELQVSRRHVALGLAAGLGCWVLLAALSVGGVFEAFDSRLLDWRFRLRGERVATKSIALVSIDDVTIRAYAGWPLPRDQYALIQDVLAAAGARAIGVDLQLPEDTNHDPRQRAAGVRVGRASQRRSRDFILGDDVGPSGCANGSGRQLRRAAPAGYCRRRGSPLATGSCFRIRNWWSRPRRSATSPSPRIGTARFDANRRSCGLKIASIRLWRCGWWGRAVATPTSQATGTAFGWGGAPAWRIALDGEGATSFDFSGDRAFSFSLFHDRGASRAPGRRFERPPSAIRRPLRLGGARLADRGHRGRRDDAVRRHDTARLYPRERDRQFASEALHRPSIPVAVSSLLGSGPLRWLGFATLPMTIAAIVAGSAVLTVAIVDVVLLPCGATTCHRSPRCWSRPWRSLR